MSKKVEVKKEVKGQRERIYKDNKKFISRRNAKNKNGMETIIAPSNKHQSLFNNQGSLANKINEMLKISLNKLINKLFTKLQIKYKSMFKKE
jgi:hypothetical protein